MSDRTRNPSMGRDNRGKGRGGRGVGRVKMADREIEELEAAIKVRGATRTRQPPPQESRRRRQSMSARFLSHPPTPLSPLLTGDRPGEGH